jgi:hypothetical protein
VIKRGHGHCEKLYRFAGVGDGQNNRASHPHYRRPPLLRRDLTIRLGGMMVVAVGVILTELKLIH